MTDSEDIDVEIRWPDVDAYGHVSHMALVAIAEHGRSRWLDAVLEAGPATWPYVIARLELDFRSPGVFTDRFIRCHFEPLQTGHSSVHLAERFTTPDGRMVMEANSVIVAWDEAGSSKRPLSDEEASRLKPGR